MGNGRAAYGKLNKFFVYVLLDGPGRIAIGPTLAPQETD